MKMTDAKAIVDSIDLSMFAKDGALDYTEIAKLVSKYTNHQFVDDKDGIVDDEVIKLAHLVEAYCIVTVSDVPRLYEAYKIIVDYPTLSRNDVNIAVVCIMLYIQYKEIIAFDNDPEEQYLKKTCYEIISCNQPETLWGRFKEWFKEN